MGTQSFFLKDVVEILQFPFFAVEIAKGNLFLSLEMEISNGINESEGRDIFGCIFRDKSNG